MKTASVPATWAFPDLPDIEVSSSESGISQFGRFPGDVILTGRSVDEILAGRGQALFGTGRVGIAL